MAKFALVIAIEKYKDSAIDPVLFAQSDASEFAAALKLHGFTIQKVMLDHDATKASMKSQIKRGVALLTKDDTFFLYYAGHGFSDSGKNYLTCHDTDPSDLVATSLSLRWIFKQIELSNSQRIAIFLDSCESGITKIDDRRGLYSQMSQAEIDLFFKESQFRVCFSACKTSESSYSDRTLKHGIWTYHILKALRGEVPRVLANGRYLTAHGLQDYLSQEVPVTVRQSKSGPVVQTPWMYGGHSRDFQIADLSLIIAARSSSKLSDKQIRGAIFRVAENLNVKSLTGFKKRFHHVPDSMNSTTRSFVESISSEDVDQRIESVFQDIQSGFGYKRREVKCESGKILTPDFEYTVSCTQHDEDPTLATLTEEIGNMKAEIINDERFNDVFSLHFDELVFLLDSEIEVEEVIDAIENSAVKGLTVDYSSDASWCEISISGRKEIIRITAEDFIVKTVGKKSPKELIEALYEVRKGLAGTAAMKLLPSDS
jgi:uncharacterized caspase-like protein